jgi:parvulin-like peptidyl-prolyl isomerase
MKRGRERRAISGRGAVLLVLVSLSLSVAFTSGCGGDDASSPDESVATVGDTVITKADFKRAQAKGTTRQSSRRLRNAVLETLIKAEWIRQEARVRGIAVTNAEVQRALEAAKQSPLLGGDSLKQAGLTLDDIEANLRNTELQRKVTAALTAGSGEVSAQEIEGYYREHKAELRVEERRDLRLVLTESRARVAAAKAAIESGRPWRSVAMEYSLHPSRNAGGRVENLRKGPVQSPLVVSAFRARKGDLTGPIQADESSWAVFMVDRIKPGFQASFERARDDIRDFLIAGRRREALAAFTSKYRERTICSPGFEVPACRNG